MTYTNDKVHKIIEKNFSKSAMYSGSIKGVGPRYCPSIEDKIVKFADKQDIKSFWSPKGLMIIQSTQMGYQLRFQVTYNKKYVTYQWFRKC